MQNQSLIYLAGIIETVSGGISFEVTCTQMRQHRFTVKCVYWGKNSCVAKVKWSVFISRMEDEGGKCERSEVFTACICTHAHMYRKASL